MQKWPRALGARAASALDAGHVVGVFPAAAAVSDELWVLVEPLIPPVLADAEGNEYCVLAGIQ